MPSRTPSHRTAVRTLSLAATLAALAAPRPAGAAWPHSPFTNLPVCTAAGSQSGVQLASDGAGGAYLVWSDERAGAGAGADIYAQHVLRSGVVDPAWPADGLALCNASGQQTAPDLVADGAGGAFVVWQDFRGASIPVVYAHHLIANGADPAWPSQGKPVRAAGTYQYSPQIVSDGMGGAFVSWHEGGGATSNDIWAHHLLASGAPDPAWPADGLGVCVLAGLQSYAQLALAAPGIAVVTWRDTRGTSWDIYAQRVIAGVGVDPAWPANGQVLCAAAGQQDNPVVSGDGTGGAIVVWRDARNGSATDVYAQHVLASGAVDPAWPVDGRALCLAADSQLLMQIVSDAAGGAFVAWQDNRSAATGDIYAAHVLASGLTDPGWPTDGLAVCTAAFDQSYPAIAADGAGGAIVTWQDNRSGYEIYAQHVMAATGVDPAWPYNGSAISTAANSQYYPQLAEDGAGGAIVAWSDARGSASGDLYAQRVARFGQLGAPEAVLLPVADVPDDQGGRVKLSWDASWLDRAGSSFVTGYDVLRSVPPQLASLRVARGARVRAGLAGEVAPGELVAIVTGTTVAYWELLTTVPALHYLDGYSLVAPTTSDSLPGSNPLTSFMIVARDDSRSRYWPSTPASGYSVDDLAPAKPAPFTGAMAGGATRLHWEPNVEVDLAGYRLYRGSDAAFVPGPASLVAALADTGYTDAAGAPFWYKLTAVDLHGNESPVAVLAPEGTLDVGGGPAPFALALETPAPNPARGSTTVRFALPRSGQVLVAVHDVSGRVVRTLADGSREAGGHVVSWDLRGDDGHVVNPGLYYVRIESAGRTLARTLAVLR
jgi:hypothetical protein